MLSELKDISYEDRLKALSLPTLACRRLRGNMIETYKILNKKYDEEVSNFLPLHRTISNAHYKDTHSSYINTSPVRTALDTE